MSPKYEEDLSSALGAICEVLTRKIIFSLWGGYRNTTGQAAGSVQSCVKGEGTPGGVLYHEPVKVHIYMGQEQGKVMIAYGQVERNAADHWWIELENVVSGPERRENFRQMVRGRGILTDREGEKAALQFGRYKHQRGEILQSGPVYRGGKCWSCLDFG